MGLMPEPNPTVIINSRPPLLFSVKYAVMGIAFCLIILLIFFLLAPLGFYLKLYSLFSPYALKVDNTDISWDQLKQELSVASLDKNLKTRGRKLERATNNSLELQILRSSVATPSANSSPPASLFAEHMVLKDAVGQKFVNSRTGGYFIARFAVPQATESAQVLKDKAKTEITALKVRLDKGENFQKLLNEATMSANLKYLNGGAFPAGVYLTNISPDQFPLKISTLKDLFFSLEEGEISGILTLSWDDYYGAGYGQKFSGDFAYAVAKIDKYEKGSFNNFDEWLKNKKLKLNFKSYVPIPFYFKWL